MNPDANLTQKKKPPTVFPNTREKENFRFNTLLYRSAIATPSIFTIVQSIMAIRRAAFVSASKSLQLRGENDERRNLKFDWQLIARGAS